MRKTKPGTAKSKKAAKPRGRKVTKVIDIDLANRDNVVNSVMMNSKGLTEQEAILIASIIVDVTALLKKNWSGMRDIRDGHFQGKLKFNMPIVVDCTTTPATVKVKLNVPRPAHKDAMESTTEDPDQLTMNTVEDTLAVRTGNGGNIETPSEAKDKGNGAPEPENDPDGAPSSE